MKKLLILVSGLMLTMAATSFAGNDTGKTNLKPAKAACCSCTCGDDCSPGACPNDCGCCCDN